jgi:uncharacterized protein (DUF1778 family)
MVTMAARLEARVTREQKEFIERAAELEGRSLTEFLVSSAHAAAKQVIREHEILTLSARDRAAFVDALLSPPAPNQRLRRAARRYRKSFR